MKRKQVLVLILSASMFLGTSVGTVSFAKEPTADLQNMQELLAVQNDAETEENANAQTETVKNPEEIENAESQADTEADTDEKSGEEETSAKDTMDQKEEKVAEQSDDEVNQAVAGTTVYLDTTSGSDDANNGSDASHAVQTLDKALELAGENGTVMVTGTRSPIITTAVTLENGVTVKRDSALKANQAVLEIDGGSLTINDATVDGGKNEIAASTDTGSVIFIRKGTVTMNDGGKIANCWDDGIWVFTGLPDGESSFIMNGGEICNIGGASSKAQNWVVQVAAGAKSYPKASFIMKGGSIHDNIVGAGVVYLPVAGGGGFDQEFQMEGGSIKNNKGIDGKDPSGRAVLLRDGKVNMSGGEISGNSGTNGGALCIWDYGQFTMSGGTISNNTAVGTKSSDGYGGAICIMDNTSSVTITGGTIAGNHADRGGAISAWDNSQVNISGGTISGNDALYGGGIRIENTANLTMTGGTVERNTAKWWGGGLDILGSSTAEITGGQIYKNESPWGGGMFIWQTKNVTIGGTVEIKENTADPDANGDDGAGGGIVLNSGAMKITGGTISGNHARYGGGIKVEGGTATIEGTVVIRDNTVEDKSGEEDAGGGGIAATGGTTNITGGTISANKAIFGAGIGIWNKAVVNIKDAKITDNTASGYGGGGISVAANTLTMDGATISGNKAPFGSAIGIWGDGNVVMNGKTGITGNQTVAETEYDEGGTVYVKGSRNNGASFVMNSGSITGNTTDDAYGAGIVVNGGKAGGSVEINGGTISGNTNVSGVRQGVLLYKGSAKNGTVKLSGSPDIGDEIYLNDHDNSGAKIEVTGKFTPKNPVPVNDTNWANYNTIVTYATGLTANLADFTPVAESERRGIIQDAKDAQNLQSINKHRVVFRDKENNTKYGEVYIMPDGIVDEKMIPETKKEGCTLLGWKEGQTGKDWDFRTDKVTDDLTLYPDWRVDKIIYQVTVKDGDQDHGTMDVEKDQTIDSSKLPTLTKPGYDLDGWETADGKAWDVDNDKVTSNVELHPVWKLKNPTGSLTAENAVDGKVTIHAGETAVLTATADHEAEGDINYTFIWYKDGKELDVKGKEKAVSDQNAVETSEEGSGRAASAKKAITVSEAGTYSVKIKASDGTQKTDAVETNSVEVAVTDHTFGEWTIVKQPTETENGLKERTCTICNLKETEEIPATGKKDDTKPEDPKQDDSKTDPSKPDNSKADNSKPGTGQKTDSTTTVKKSSKSAKTGDTTGLGLAVGAMTLAAGAGAGVVIRRKKRS